MLSDNLSSAWTSDYESLKQFVSDHLKIDGIRRILQEIKLFTSEHVTLSWRKSKNVLLVVGEKATDIVKELCNGYVIAAKAIIHTASSQAKRLTFIMILRTLYTVNWPMAKQFSHCPTLFVIFRLFYRKFKILSMQEKKQSLIS